MNIFIYDSFLNHKKYDKLLARLETRITDLGLNGKIQRLSLMRNVKDAVRNELKRGAKTIIAVGNNKIINQVINSLAGSPVPLGVIPVGDENNEIAAGLGIRSSLEACDVLAARLLVRLDLGLADKTYFLKSAAIDNKETVIDMSDDYTIETSNKGLIQIFNLADPNVKLLPQIRVLPDDGILELAINSQSSKNIFRKEEDQSIFKIKRVVINNPKTQLILDGSISLATPAVITVAPQILNVIVGKNRGF